MNENEFATGSVPVMVAARIYGKDASWVRAGIISGWLPIGSHPETMPARTHEASLPYTRAATATGTDP